MPYFLKSVGLADDPLPELWWEERPEIAEAMYFHKRPIAIRPESILIYYAVGGDGRLCGVARVTGTGSGSFDPPKHWTEAMCAKFTWRMPVRVIHRCAADARAPRLADFQDQRIGQGPFQSVRDDLAKRMIDAIAASETQGAVR